MILRLCFSVLLVLISSCEMEGGQNVQSESLEIRQDSSSGLKVDFLFPKGSVAQSFDKITIIFNKPITFADKRWKDVPFKIYPPTPLSFRWINERMAEAIFLTELKPASRYKIVVPAGIRAVDGSILDKDIVRLFETPRPEVTGIYPKENSYVCPNSPKFLLVVNQPVKSSSMKNYVVFLLESGQEIEGLLDLPSLEDLKEILEPQIVSEMIGLTEKGHVVKVTPSTQIPSELSFELVIKPGFVGNAGPLPSNSEKHLRYYFYKKFTVHASTCPYGICPTQSPSSATITFSNPVPMEEILSKIKKTLPPNTSSGSIYGATTQIMAVDNPQDDKVYEIHIPSDLKDICGQTLGNATTFTFRFADTSPYFEDFVGRGVMESLGPHLYPLVVRNISEAFADIAVVPKEKLANVFYTFYEDTKKIVELPSKTVSLPIPKKEHEKVYLPLDLSSVVPQNTPNIIHYEVLAGNDEYGFSEASSNIVQVTNLGLTSIMGDELTHFWVTRLSDARPVSSAKIEVRDEVDRVLWSGMTNQNGVVSGPGKELLLQRLNPLPNQKHEQHEEDEDYYQDKETLGLERLYAIAFKDDDVVVLPLKWAKVYGESPCWHKTCKYGWTKGRWRFVIILDRDIYRENEEVLIKGWGVNLSYGGIKPAVKEKSLLKIFPPSEHYDEPDIPIQTIPVQFDDFGAFSARYKIPPNAKYGDWAVCIVRPEFEQENIWNLPCKDFKVTFFKNPEFTVEAWSDKSDYIKGENAKFTVFSSYYFGQALSEAIYKYYLSYRKTYFSPEGFEDYDFWSSQESYEWVWENSRTVDQQERHLDTKGTDNVIVKLLPPFSGTTLVEFEAVVKDVSGETVAKRATAMVHSASFYLGLKRIQGFVETNKPVPLEVVAVSPSGHLVGAKSVEIKVYKNEYHSYRRKGVCGIFEDETSKVKFQKMDYLIDNLKGKSVLNLTFDEPGEYQIIGRATDEEGRVITSDITLDVADKDESKSGHHGTWKPSDEGDNTVDLETDKEEYKPGETARVLIKSPFEDSWAFVFAARGGVIWSKVFQLKGNTTPIDIPILDSFAPNVEISTVVVRGRNESKEGIRPGDPDAPAVLVGSTLLYVSHEERKLRVEVETKARVEPKQDVIADITVTDHKGRGVQSQLLVMAVDSAILDLSQYEVINPQDIIYSPYKGSVRIGDVRKYLIRRRVFGIKTHDIGGDGGINIRKDFLPVAFYDAKLVTNSDGKARIRFKAPDSLTKYEVIVIAGTKEMRFGTGSSSFVVNKPFMVRPSLPAFVEVGDTFNARVFLHARKGLKGKADISLSVKGQGHVISEDKAVVEISEHGLGYASFQVVADKVGEIEMEIRGTAGNINDGVLMKIPVRDRFYPETKIYSGVSNWDVEEHIGIPNDIRWDVGKLRVSATSTGLGRLENAARYLLDYPYGCLEQRMSKILPAVVFYNIAKDFGFETDKYEMIERGIKETLTRLGRYQRSNGGFGFWESGEDSSHDPYLTAYTILTVSNAIKAGYTVDKNVIDKAIGYLSNILKKPTDVIDQDDEIVYDYENINLLSFIAFVLKQHEVNVDDVLDLLIARRGEMSRVGLGFLLATVNDDNKPVVEDCIERITKDVVVSHNVVYFPTSYTEDYYQDMVSGEFAETIAMIIGLSYADPDHELLPYLVEQLFGEMKNGRWSNTHENGLALLALKTYFEIMEELPAHFMVTPYIDGDPLAQWSFSGRSTETQHIEIPIARLIGNQGAIVRFDKMGIGTLYWNISLSWVPKEQHLVNDRGIFVERNVISLKDRIPTNHLKSGEAGAIAITLWVSKDLGRTVLDVPLPGGVLGINNTFALRSENLEREINDISREEDTLYCSYSEIRDDRVICYLDSVEKGIYQFVFGIRAMVPGRYAFPGAIASSMYHPEVFGVSEKTWFEVL